MKKLLLVAVTMLAFTFQSNAQDEPRVNPFEISLGAALPMSDYGDGANTGIALRAGASVPMTNVGSVNVCLGGMYINNGSQIEGVSHNLKVFGFGLDFLVSPQIRFKTLVIGGLYGVDIDLGDDFDIVSESEEGVGYDLRLEFLLDQHIFLCVNYMNLRIGDFEDFGLGVFGVSMGAKF